MTEHYIGRVPTSEELGLNAKSDLPYYDEIEGFLKTATQKQRAAVGEFIGVLAKDGDSGSIHTVLETCLDMTSMEYLLECLKTIEFTRQAIADGMVNEL